MVALPRLLAPRNSCEWKGVTILPNNMKYAHVERERRYLSRGAVPELRPTRILRIHDSYVSHSSLRLRRIDEVGKLPARFLEKQRSIFDLGDWQFAVDVFEGDLAGLVLVEVDLGPYGEVHPTLPLQELVEVTLNERFTGGKLADTSFAELQSVLREYGVN